MYFLYIRTALASEQQHYHMSGFHQKCPLVGCLPGHPGRFSYMSSLYGFLHCNQSDLIRPVTTICPVNKKAVTVNEIWTDSRYLCLYDWSLCTKYTSTFIIIIIIIIIIINTVSLVMTHKQNDTKSTYNNLTQYMHCKQWKTLWKWNLLIDDRVLTSATWLINL